jgi:hypothetical protein
MWHRAPISLPAAWLLLVFNTECLANYVVFVRPQLATYVGFIAVLAILRAQWDRLSPAIWIVPVAMVPWTNLHGGFLAGVALTALFAIAACGRSFLRLLHPVPSPPSAGERVRVRGLLQPFASLTLALSPIGMGERGQERTPPWWNGEAATWVLVALATALATLVNPYGFGLHRMLWEHLVTAQLVLEWQPVWEATPSAVYAVPFLLTFLALACSRRWQWIDAIVLLAVGGQAASHIRHIALFGLATLVLLPLPLSDALPLLFPQLTAAWSRRSRRWWRWTACGLIVSFLAALHVRGVQELWRDGLRPWDVAVETQSGVPGMPVAAVGEIRRRGWAGNLLTDYGWGQFALWDLYPDVRVAFDGRYRTVYPAHVEADLLALQRAAAEHAPTTPLVDAYPTDLVLAPVGGSIERYLVQRADWECVFRDGQAALFVPRQRSLPNGNPGDQTALPTVVPTLRRWIRFPGDGA